MYNFVKKNEKIFVIEYKLYGIRFARVGEIILNESYAEINLSSTLISFYEQVDLFKAIVERFEEVKNKEVRFTETKEKEILTDKLLQGAFVLA